jgi:hypothetical protein
VQFEILKLISRECTEIWKNDIVFPMWTHSFWKRFPLVNDSALELGNNLLGVVIAGLVEGKMFLPYPSSPIYLVIIYTYLHMWIPWIYYSIKCFPTAHVDLMNILQHQVLSDYMCIPWIYDSSKWFPTAHVHPMNILQQQMISYWTCTSNEYITALSVFLLHMYIP